MPSWSEENTYLSLSAIFILIYPLMIVQEWLTLDNICGACHPGERHIPISKCDSHPYLQAHDCTRVTYLGQNVKRMPSWSEENTSLSLSTILTLIYLLMIVQEWLTLDKMCNACHPGVKKTHLYLLVQFSSFFTRSWLYKSDLPWTIYVVHAIQEWDTSLSLSVILTLIYKLMIVQEWLTLDKMCNACHPGVKKTHHYL